jgi:hypothetical protein
MNSLEAQYTVPTLLFVQQTSNAGQHAQRSRAWSLCESASQILPAIPHITSTNTLRQDVYNQSESKSGTKTPFHPKA